MSKYERLARLAKVMALLKAQRQSRQVELTEKRKIPARKGQDDEASSVRDEMLYSRS